MNASRTIYLESLYAKKWEEIYNGDKNSDAYKKLETILNSGVNRLSMDYGHFWKTGGNGNEE
jgi:hypothetical protein